jgi:hypothetical protein
VAHFQRDTVVASPTYGALTFQSAVVDNAPGVNGLDGATSVRLSPTGDHLYVASSVEKAIAVFSRDGGTGALTWVEAKFDGQRFDGSAIASRQDRFQAALRRFTRDELARVTVRAIDHPSECGHVLPRNIEWI